MPRFEILPGLPPYGPAAVAFGNRIHSEGLVVRFHPDNSESWVGNFERGYKLLDRVLLHPDQRQIIVIAGGDGQVIDPETREITHHMFGSITFITELAEPSAIVVANDCEFEALGACGVWWRSPRISWDGIRNIVVSGTNLSGEAYSPIDDQWHPFSLDLLSGLTRNAIYQEEISRAVPI